MLDTPTTVPLARSAPYRSVSRCSGPQDAAGAVGIGRGAAGAGSRGGVSARAAGSRQPKEAPGQARWRLARAHQHTGTPTRHVGLLVPLVPGIGRGQRGRGAGAGAGRRRGRGRGGAAAGRRRAGHVGLEVAVAGRVAVAQAGAAGGVAGHAALPALEERLRIQGWVGGQVGWVGGWVGIRGRVGWGRATGSRPDSCTAGMHTTRARARTVHERLSSAKLPLRPFQAQKQGASPGWQG